MGICCKHCLFLFVFCLSLQSTTPTSTPHTISALTPHPATVWESMEVSNLSTLSSSPLCPLCPLPRPQPQVLYQKCATHFSKVFNYKDSGEHPLALNLTCMDASVIGKECLPCVSIENKYPACNCLIFFSFFYPFNSLFPSALVYNITQSFVKWNDNVLSRIQRKGWRWEAVSKKYQSTGKCHSLQMPFLEIISNT